MADKQDGSSESRSDLSSAEEKDRRRKMGSEERSSELQKELYRKLLMTETEVQRTRRMERQKAQSQKKRMMMTELELEKQKAKKRENYQKRRLEETEEQKKTRLEGRRETYRKLKERETPEEFQERLKLTNERVKRRKMNETPEEREIRLERERMNHKKWSQKMTAEQLEARRQRNKEHRKKRKEKQRQKARERDRADIPQTDGSQNAEASETATNRLTRSAECTDRSEIRQQLERDTPESVLTVSDESTDTLDTRKSSNESDDKISDSDADDDRTTNSNGKKSDCSMMLAEKWGLRTLVVRLERIDLAELVHKDKQESSPDDDSAAVNVKRTRKQSGSVAAPSAQITRWFKAISPSA